LDLYCTYKILDLLTIQNLLYFPVILLISCSRQRRFEAEMFCKFTAVKILLPCMIFLHYTGFRAVNGKVILKNRYVLCFHKT
jgi:hypothetical protein